MKESLDQLQARSAVKSTLVSRNITVNGHRTSVRLEPAMWNALKDISKREQCSIHDLCGLISVRKNEKTSLTAAIRVFLMLYFRAASTEEGHRKAGHGDFEHMKRRAGIEPKEVARPDDEDEDFDGDDGLEQDGENIAALLSSEQRRSSFRNRCDYGRV